MLQISHSSVSPDLGDSERYPYLARVIESTGLHNFAIVKILRHFGWTKIASISRDAVFATQVSLYD